MKPVIFLAVAASCCAQTPVIVISIDTLRADHVDSRRAPQLLSWASRGGTLFSAAASQIPLTLPSHTVLFTSTYPYENHVEENAGNVPRSAVTLASVLQARGYQTAAFIGSIFLERQLGLDRGFDTYDSPFRFGAFSRLSGEMLFAGNGNNYAARERRPGALVIRAANQWMAAHKNQPVFVFIHLFDVHKPYPLGSYDAQVGSVNRLLGGFQRTLQQEGWWDRSLVVLTSDHGEGLGEHGESDHGYFIYESTLHVPLIVHWPQGAARLPARVEQPVGLVDVAPSILDFLKIPAPPAFHGRSFLDGSARPVFSESVYARDSFGWSALRSLRAGPWKYIDAPKPELYDLSKDPRELNNLVKAHPSEAAGLRAQLAKYTAQTTNITGNSGDPRRKKEVLESLGYLAPGPRATAKGSAADPKDRLPLLLRYEEALNLLAAKNYDAAVAKLRGILAVDPGNLLVRRDLGVALIERKEFEKAIPELQHVAVAAPDDYVTRFELGIATEQVGRLREAADQFEAAARLAPDAAQAKDALERVRRKLGGTGQ
ncbi:MAG: sulfatase-like hydrolase/transferase [Acidobacteriota bacterium]